MFIITSVITMPLAFVGFLNRLFLSEKEIELAKSRLERTGVKIQAAPFSWKSLRRIFTSSRFYLIVVWNIFFFNTSANTAAFLLWIKSLHRYSIPTVNNLETIAPALGIFHVLFINFGADLAFGRVGAITIACAWNLTGLIILTIWDVPESAKWFAFSTGYALVAVSSVSYGWVNVMLRRNVEERALTLILMTAIATSTNAWIPLLVYPTVEAPRFHKGYPFSAAMVVVSVLMTQLVRVVFNRDEARNAAEERVEGGGELESVEEEVGKEVVVGKKELDVVLV